MDDFYAVRSGAIPPLPWQIFAPPLISQRKNRRISGQLSAEINNHAQAGSRRCLRTSLVRPDRLFLSGQHRRSRLPRAGRQVGNRGPLPPLRKRLLVDPVALVGRFVALEAGNRIGFSVQMRLIAEAILDLSLRPERQTRFVFKWPTRSRRVQGRPRRRARHRQCGCHGRPQIQMCTDCGSPRILRTGAASWCGGGSGSRRR